MKNEISAFPHALAQTLPPRLAEGHKGTYGRARLFCGSALYTGAALLAAEGAMRMGAGLTYLYAPQAAVDAARVRLPELICRVCPSPAEDAAAAFSLLPPSEEKGALLIGCGIGQGDAAAFSAACTPLFSSSGVPTVLDADALNMLAASADRGLSLLRGAKRPLLLTPHPLEFARLTGLSVAEVQADRAGHAAAYAQESGAYLLLKGAGSVIAAPDGRTSVNPSGCSALSKGGSGDVLAGMLVGLLAQGMPPYEALSAAAYLHGAAGERLAAVYSEYGVLPSELAGEAARVLADICHI